MIGQVLPTAGEPTVLTVSSPSRLTEAPGEVDEPGGVDRPARAGGERGRAPTGLLAARPAEGAGDGQRARPAEDAAGLGERSRRGGATELGRPADDGGRAADGVVAAEADE